MVIRTQYELTDYLVKKANLTRLGPAALTMIILSGYVNGEWKCWPATQTLADRTGTNIKTIQRHINFLSDRGVITRVKGRHGNSQHLHNIYTINIATLLALGGNEEQEL